MAEFDAFSEGVAPGGLRSQNDIRILVCYVLKSVNAALSESDIITILQEKSLANYFEIQDAISQLLAHNNIMRNSEGDLEICDSGRNIADNLDTALPLSVRDKALEAAVRLLTRAKHERENQVEIEKTENGYQVNMHVSGGSMELMSISVYMPDKKQARMVKRNFHQNPGKIYELLLAALTDDKALAQDLFKD